MIRLFCRGGALVGNLACQLGLRGFKSPHLHGLKISTVKNLDNLFHIAILGIVDKLELPAKVKSPKSALLSGFLVFISPSDRAV